MAQNISVQTKDPFQKLFMTFYGSLTGTWGIRCSRAAKQITKLFLNNKKELCD